VRKRSSRAARPVPIASAAVGLGALALILGVSLFFLSGPSRKARRPASSRSAGAPQGDVAAGPAARRAFVDVSELVRLARAEFEQGLECWQAAGEPGSPGEQAALAQARAHFMAAQDHLARAQEANPGHYEVQQLAEETNRLMSNCIRRSKVAVPP